MFVLLCEELVNKGRLHDAKGICIRHKLRPNDFKGLGEEVEQLG